MPKAMPGSGHRGSDPHMGERSTHLRFRDSALTKRHCCLGWFVVVFSRGILSKNTIVLRETS